MKRGVGGWEQDGGSEEEKKIILEGFGDHPPLLQVLLPHTRVYPPPLVLFPRVLPPILAADFQGGGVEI